MKKLLKFIQKIEPNKEKSKLLHTIYDGLYTLVFSPNTVTKEGVHIRDGIDLKRTMFFVVIALQLAYLFGAFNIGHQHFLALGQYTEVWDGWHLKLIHGFIKLLPIFVVSNLVGLGVEFVYAARRGHPIQEGYLVSGALIPLIMPPDIPLWMLTVAIIFAVIIGKEAFGGTGMNVFNVALLTRVFLFFAYPTHISGDSVWVSGINGHVGEVYGWAHHMFDSLFGALGWEQFGAGGGKVIDSFSGATPLGLASHGGWEEVTKHYSPSDMWWGLIPGSIGETSKPFIILGAIFLLVTKIASWRIMLSMLIGAALTALMMNGIGAPGSFAAVPWYYQFYMGSFFFAMAFMATDPVTAASTPKGKLIYGFLIGMIGMMIRVFNPAYPEGWMLAILFMNVFAPLIDYFIIDSHIKKRLKRA